MWSEENGFSLLFVPSTIPKMRGDKNEIADLTETPLFCAAELVWVALGSEYKMGFFRPFLLPFSRVSSCDGKD
jgi:hypothetical protein